MIVEREKREIEREEGGKVMSRMIGKIFKMEKS
jgi:hypothetical protein